MSPAEIPAADLEAFVRAFRGEPWAAADWLAEHFPEADYPRTHASNQLHADLERCRRRIAQELGDELNTDTLRTYRATAIAWPDGVRTPSATFGAHEKLRGRRDRVEAMAQYVKRARREESTHLQRRHVLRYRAEERGPRPGPTKTLGELLAENVDRACRAKLRSAAGVIVERADWWNTDRLTDADRAILADRFADLANAIRGR